MRKALTGKQDAAMDPRDLLLDKLKRHPELVHREIPGGLRIEAPSPTGFAIELRGDEHGWTVWLGNAGFHEDFQAADEVLDFVAWCYSGEARVRELWRGTMPERSILEACEDGAWHEVAATVFVFVPFWRRRTEVVLRNPNLLEPLP